MFCKCFGAIALISALVIAGIGSEKCEVSQSEAEHSAAKILFFGDRGAHIPKDDGGISKYCRMVKQNLKVTLKYARCLKPFPKTVIGVAFGGFKRAAKKRCVDQKWREDFVKLGKCMRGKNLTENLHRCTDDGSVAFEYVKKEIPPKDQVLVSCCVYGSIMSVCFREEAAACGAETADFAYLLQNEPAQDAFNVMCSALNSPEKCEKKYGNYMKKIRHYLKTPRKPNYNVMTSAILVMLGDDFLD